MFSKFISVSNNTTVALCLSAVVYCEIARSAAFVGEVNPSACSGMP